MNPARWLGFRSHFFSAATPRHTKLRITSIKATEFYLPERARNSLTGILGGQFILLNLEVNLGWPIEWGKLRDPAIPSDWRLAFHSMEFLRDLLLEPDKARAQNTIWQFLQAWMEQFPEPSSVNSGDAWLALATARRLLVWCELAYAAPPPDTLIRDYILSCVRQAKWLQRILLDSDSPLNHSVMAAAMGTVGCFFEGPWAEGLRKRGLSFLDYTLHRLTAPDGDLITRTPMHYLQLSRLLRGMNTWLAPVDTRACQSYFDWAKTFEDTASLLRHPDGTLPQFNATTNDNFAAEPPTITHQALLCGPYAIYRSSQFSLIFDGGPLAIGKPNPFGHAAPLNFELSFGNRRILVDSGWCAPKGERHRVFRAPQSHNTLTIAGKSAGKFGANGIYARPFYHPPRFVKHPLGTWIHASHSYYAWRGVRRLIRLWFISKSGDFIASIHVGFGVGGSKHVQEFLQLNHGIVPHALSPGAFGLAVGEPLVLQIHLPSLARVLAGQVSQHQYLQLASSTIELQQHSRPPILSAWAIHKGTTQVPFAVQLENKTLRLSHQGMGSAGVEPRSGSELTASISLV